MARLAVLSARLKVWQLFCLQSWGLVKMMDELDFRRRLDAWIMQEQDIGDEEEVVVEMPCSRCGEWNHILDINPVNCYCWRCDVWGGEE